MTASGDVLTLRNLAINPVGCCGLIHGVLPSTTALSSRTAGRSLMTRVTLVTENDLLTRRAEILERHGVSLEEFADRARRYALIGDEWADWDELQSIAFLLRDE